MSITSAGQTLAHLPQPTHSAPSTRAVTPDATRMAVRGQTFTQVPQATHSRPTWANLFDSAIISPSVSN